MEPSLALGGGGGALAVFEPSGEVLELACGTGWWTEELVRYADSVTAADYSPEALEINRKKVGEERVRHVRTDRPTTSYFSVSGSRTCRPSGSLASGRWCDPP